MRFASDQRGYGNPPNSWHVEDKPVRNKISIARFRNDRLIIHPVLMCWHNGIKREALNRHAIYGAYRNLDLKRLIKWNVVNRQSNRSFTAILGFCCHFLPASIVCAGQSGLCDKDRPQSNAAKIQGTKSASPSQASSPHCDRQYLRPVLPADWTTICAKRQRVRQHNTSARAQMYLFQP